MLNSAEHAQLSWTWKKFKKIVSILRFISKINFVLSWVEHKKLKFYNLGAWIHLRSSLSTYAMMEYYHMVLFKSISALSIFLSLLISFHYYSLSPLIFFSLFIRLRFEYILQCNEDFYSKCDRFCHPDPVRYRCNSQGRHVCNPGRFVFYHYKDYLREIAIFANTNSHGVFEQRNIREKLTHWVQGRINVDATSCSVYKVALTSIQRHDVYTTSHYFAASSRRSYKVDATSLHLYNVILTPMQRHCVYTSS